MREAVSAENWELFPHSNALEKAEETKDFGWLLFPLAVEFLDVFSGFSTQADAELYIGAWRDIPKSSLSHPELIAARQEHRLFPVGLAAGWVPLLLRDDGRVFCSVNGQFGPLFPNSPSTIETLILQIAQRRADERLEE
ncbi:SUKH-3 domain-containing protein [Deinococcus arcticus]|uniref:SUKH-3 domain-containing protein n=1 Tax=Deinococcus arcticus TaxID=2136176 RepID=UPI001304A8DD|nr:SUKH-3 domain-containing protein [Deinococcus arcticus]